MSFFATIDGKRRGLGLLPPKAGTVCDLPVFGDTVETLDKSTLKRIAQSPTSVGRTLFDSSFIRNQGQYGSCNGFAGAAALTRARIRRGLKRRNLSGAYLYSLINGGRDNGSHLSAGMRTLAERGCATEALVAWNQIYPHKYDKAQANRQAAKFKAFECYRVTNEAELWTALALGWDVVVAVHVGSRFSKLRNGVAGVDSGRGNHAVSCDGLLYVNGEIVADAYNSWGTGWGDRGRMLLRWSHFRQTIGIHSFYAIRSTTDDERPPAVR